MRYTPNPLVRFCQGGILNLRPTVLNTCTGYLPFYGSNCGLKGAAILHNWLPCAIQYCGSQALAVPFCFGTEQGHSAHYDYTQSTIRPRTRNRCEARGREIQEIQPVSFNRRDFAGYGKVLRLLTEKIQQARKLLSSSFWFSNDWFAFQRSDWFVFWRLENFILVNNYFCR